MHLQYPECVIWVCLSSQQNIDYIHMQRLLPKTRAHRHTGLSPTTGSGKCDNQPPLPYSLSSRRIGLCLQGPVRSAAYSQLLLLLLIDLCIVLVPIDYQSLGTIGASTTHTTDIPSQKPPSGERLPRIRLDSSYQQLPRVQTLRGTTPLKPLSCPHGTTPLKPSARDWVLTSYYLWAYIPI